MEKINKNYIYAVAIILIVSGLYLIKVKDKDLALEVINDHLIAEEAKEVEISDTTARLLSSVNKKMMTLKIYFPNPEMATEDINNCLEVFPVNRSVAETITPARASLLELFKGPTTEEKDSGFSTGISSDIKIQKLTIKDSVAIIDVDKLTGEGDNDQCKRDFAIAGIKETLKQFLTVDSVILSVNGTTEDTL